MRIRCASASLCVLIFVACCLAAGNSGTASSGGNVRLSDLDISKTQQGWEKARKDRSVDGNPLQIAGRTFERGVGTHADSILYIELGGGSTRFHAMVGVDDEVMNPQRTGGAHAGSVEFRILGDGKELYKSGVMRSRDAAKEVNVDVAGVNMLVLVVDSGNDMNYDHADSWSSMSGIGFGQAVRPARPGQGPRPRPLAAGGPGRLRERLRRGGPAPRRRPRAALPGGAVGNCL